MLSRAQFPWVALLVIAAAIFVSVTSEFLPTGLLARYRRRVRRVGVAGRLPRHPVRRHGRAHGGTAVDPDQARLAQEPGDRRHAPVLGGERRCRAGSHLRAAAQARASSAASRTACSGR